jgi:hypothetical protein
MASRRDLRGGWWRSYPGGQTSDSVYRRRLATTGAASASALVRNWWQIRRRRFHRDRLFGGLFPFPFRPFRPRTLRFGLFGRLNGATSLLPPFPLRWLFGYRGHRWRLRSSYRNVDVWTAPRVARVAVALIVSRRRGRARRIRVRLLGRCRLARRRHDLPQEPLA